MDAVILILLIATLLAPMLAILFSIRCYKSYRSAPEPKRSLPIPFFVGLLLLSAFITYWLGAIVGANIACSSTSASYLCGLWGAYIVGPLFSSLAIALLAQVWSSNARSAP